MKELNENQMICQLNTQYNLLVGEKTCFEYSDEPDQLKELLNRIQFVVRISEPKRSEWGENLLSLPMVVQLSRGGKQIEFNYFGSHNDAMNFMSVSRYKEITDSPYSKGHFMKHFGKDIFDSSFKLSNRQKLGKREFIKNLKYSILCSIRCDFFIDPSFQAWCDELGYDSDSIKVRQTFENCFAHSQKLMNIFKFDDMDCLPC